MASATNIWLMYLNSSKDKILCYFAFFFMGTTAFNLLLHRGSYSHDVMIGFMVSICIFYVLKNSKYFLKYYCMKILTWFLFKMNCIERTSRTQQSNNLMGIFNSYRKTLILMLFILVVHIEILYIV